MESSSTFGDLLARARQGDARAVQTIVDDYLPHVRRIARVRLKTSSLGRQFDSADICQSVLADFFARIALGQFDFESPEKLAKLLATMTANKVKAHKRKFKTQKRDLGRQEALDASEIPIADRRPTPGSIAMQRELLAIAKNMLTADELVLLEERRSNRPWAELAAERGVKADALRMRYTRAIDRVIHALGDSDEEDSSFE